jgi:hypothetical protein
LHEERKQKVFMSFDPLLFPLNLISIAHALLITLSSAIHSYALSSNALTILHNTTTASHPSHESSLYPNQQRSQKEAKTPPPSSIFLSATQKPSLGHVFNQFPSLHVLLSLLPKTRAYAKALYAPSEDEHPSRVGYCTVVEVLKDETPILGSDRMRNSNENVKGRERKFAWREQSWTAVEVNETGVGFVGAFQDQGTMEGMGIESEKLGD